MNKFYAEQLVAALSNFSDHQVIITMPNADTSGNIMRGVYSAFASENSHVHLVENFGTLGYFSCMALCKIVAGNSSSGIIEAASLKKYVVNIGDRQEGRHTSENVIHCEPDSASIKQACQEALMKKEFCGTNIYDKGGTASKIIEVIREWKS
jgi:GDP/UDP-N,N'-diacetylbacillosamine 2-epimerase (hydrolysing)